MIVGDCRAQDALRQSPPAGAFRDISITQTKDSHITGDDVSMRSRNHESEMSQNGACPSLCPGACPSLCPSLWPSSLWPPLRAGEPRTDRGQGDNSRVAGC